MPSLAKRPKRNTGPWSSLRILNSSSPIISKDVHAFLVACISGWAENYTQEEKRSIINSLPPQYRKYEIDDEGGLICPVPIDFVLDDSYIRAGISKFTKDMREGFYEKGWQTYAKRAMQERRDGKFDGYLREHTEEVFGDHDDNADTIQADADSTDGEWRENITKCKGKRKNHQGTQALLQKSGGTTD